MSDHEEEQTILATAIPDSLLTIVQCLNVIKTDDPATLESYDRLAATAEEKQRNIFEIALKAEPPPTAEVFVLMLYGLLHAFFEGGARSSALCRSVFEVFDFDVEQEAVAILQTAFDATVALALLHLRANGVASDGDREDAITAFTRLGDIMERGSHGDQAALCAGAVCNFIGRGGDSRMLAASERALALAVRTSNEQWIGDGCLRVATATLAAVEQGRCSKLEAFDAIERAIFALPTESAARDQALGMLGTLLGSAAAAGLTQDALHGYLVAAQGKVGDLAGDVDPSLLVQPINDADFPHWMHSLRALGVLMAAVEDARLSLVDLTPALRPAAAWETWSVDHPSLWQAVPHGRSLLRSQQLDDLLLVLKHEVTHVYSMAGHLGLVSAILRAVNLDREALLWTFTEEGFREVDAEGLERLGVSPLTTYQPLALMEAEQALEAARKLQLLQHAWEPWFEGIAVFTELADDPTTQAESSTLVSTVLWNLVDESHVREGPNGNEFDGASARASLLRAEERYQAALERRGVVHLRHYLSAPFHTHYLAGYLAVRAVVSAWRKTLGKPLTGVAASQLLVHLTRYGISEALPRLNAPLGDFQSGVLHGCLKWVEQVAAIGKEDLERFLTNSETAVRWADGHLAFADVGDPSFVAEFHALRDRLAGEASAILTGDDGHPNRLGETNSDTFAVLSALAEAMKERLPSKQIIDAFVSHSLRMLSALPLGSVEAPFWLHRTVPGVFVLLRTTLSTKDTGAPGYDATFMSLTQEQFDALEREVRLRRVRRMTVTRYVDLLSKPSSSRQSGWNYLAFSCGDFFLLQPRGVRFGLTSVDETLREDVRARAARNTMRDVEARVLAKGRPGAERTLAWLAASDGRWKHDDLDLDLEPWVEHVKSVAEAMLEDDARPIQQAVSVELLARVFGDRQRARMVFNLGLGHVFPAAKTLEAAVELLFRSGRDPSPLRPPLTVPLAEPLFVESDAGWDVTPLRRVEQEQ